MKSRALPLVLLAAVLLLGITALRPASQTFDKITVREFELVDASGKKRATIKVEPEGEVLLRLFDQNQAIRVKVGADERGSGLVLLDQNTEPGLQVLTKETGNKLTLFDKNGKKREY